jgi:hypothetical protein
MPHAAEVAERARSIAVPLRSICVCLSRKIVVGSESAIWRSSRTW